MESDFANWSMIIDGDLVDRKTVQKAYRFWKAYHLRGNETECPLCQCDLEENGLFVCERCEEILPLDEKCYEHNSDYGTVCKDCCEHCQEQKAYEDAVNLEIDARLGK